METTLDTDTAKLRETLAGVYEAFKAQRIQLSGVKGLVRQLYKKRMEAQRFQSKCELLETQLARVESRLAQVTLEISNGNGSSSQRPIVVPGVSKKVLETLTRDNAKLRQTLAHMSKKGPSGVDLAIENRDLHEIIIRLRTERDAKIEEVNELQKLVALMESGESDALKEHTVSLAQQLATTKRNIEAKQSFCEQIVTENEHLKEKMYLLGDVSERITDVGHLKTAIGEAAKSQPDMRELMNRVWDGTDDDDEMNPEGREEYARPERDSLQEELDQSRKAIEENAAETGRLNQEIAHLQERNREIRDHQEEATRKLTAELENVKRERDYAREELIKSTEDANKLKREVERITAEHDGLRAKFEELTNEHLLMQSALESYENDFKKENEERRKIELSRQQLQQELERVARHHADLQQRYQDLTRRVRNDYSMPSYRRRGCDDVVDAPRTTTPDRRCNDLQCPTCERMLPSWLLEDHMKDCEGLM